MDGEMKQGGRIHDFHESLKLSNKIIKLPVMDDIYREYFPTMLKRVVFLKNGVAQKNGIDAIAVLENGRTYNIDEKIIPPDMCKFMGNHQFELLLT